MRKIFLLVMAVFTVASMHAETIYGDCGKDMEWEFNTGSGALYLIGTGPMDDYAGFQEIPWAQYTDQIKSIQTDSRSQYTTIGDCAFVGCKNLTSVDLPNTVTEIKKSAFYNCSGLTSVTIPNSVTSIGNFAFYGCSGLTSVTIPNSVTSIGNLVFYGSGLTSLVYNAHVFAYMPPSYSGAYTIPDGIEIIAGGAFEYCRGLTSVTIPNSVTSIGQNAFYGCRGLKTIIIPASVQTIGTAAFSSCVNLTVIQVSAINRYYSAVDGVLYNKNKTILHQFPAGKTGSFDIPNTVTEISGSAFYGCSDLTSVTIPNSVTSIGEYAFYRCSGLTTITCKAVNPPVLGDDVFYNVDTTIPLYVPAQSVSAYLAAEQWKRFDVKEAQGIEDIVVPADKAEKILTDGVLLIERNGKTYNAMGAEVR